MARQAERDEVYNYSGELEAYLRRIDSSKKIDQGTKQKVHEFLTHVSAAGAGLGRQAKYARHLWAVCETLGRPIVDVTRQDVERLMMSLREGYTVKHRGPTQGQKLHYSPWTIADFVMVTKRFMKYVRFGNTDRETPFPEEVRWLKKGIKPSEMRKPEFLTPQEVESMIRGADASRDKAMIAVAFEGGLRTGELLFLNVADLSFDSLGARLRVGGKTGERYVRLISSVPLLAKYLENFRYRAMPQMPLFCCESKNRYDQRLKFTGWNYALKAIAKKAGVNGKRVHSYLLRHGSATNAAKYLSDSELKIRYGWTMGSRQSATYVHLSGQDLDAKLASMYSGTAYLPLKPEFAPVTCPRCSEKSSPGTRFCGKCGTPLDPRELAKSSVEIEELKLKVDAILKALEGRK